MVGLSWWDVVMVDFLMLLLEVNLVWMYVGGGFGLLLVVVVVWDELVVELWLVVVLFELVCFGLVDCWW